MENQRGFDFIVVARYALKEGGVIMKGFLFSLSLLWVASLLFGQETSEYQAVFREINGTVEVKEPGAADWTPARQGQTIDRTAVVSTGFKSSAVIAVGNSLISAQPLTRLTVEELRESAGNERVNINLQTGRIRADVKAPAGGRTEFTVRSPTATASVRGTSFEFDGLHLRVDEGRVHVTGGDRIGAYVGVGHVISADIETGRVLNAAETAQEELVPSLPVGISNPPETPAAHPATGDISARLYW
jgi:hypothetical protein